MTDGGCAEADVEEFFTSMLEVDPESLDGEVVATAVCDEGDTLNVCIDTIDFDDVESLADALAEEGSSTGAPEEESTDDEDDSAAGLVTFAGVSLAAAAMLA